MPWDAFYGSLVTAAFTLLTVLSATAVLLPRSPRGLLARISLVSSLTGLAVAALVGLAQLAPDRDYRMLLSGTVAALGIVMVLIEVGVATWTVVRAPGPRSPLGRSQRWWLLADIPTAGAYVAIIVLAGSPGPVSIPLVFLLVAGTVETLLTAPVGTRGGAD